MIPLCCASFRNTAQNVTITKPINETTVHNKKMIIINQFNNYDPLTAESLDLKDQDIYTNNIKNLYTSAIVLNGNVLKDSCSITIYCLLF